jgi:protein-disulfide isomerase
MSESNKPGSTRPPAPKTKGTPTRRTPPPPPPKRSPVLLASVAAIGIGLVLIVVLFVAGGLPGSGPSTAIATPAFATPTELADGRSLGSAGAPITIDVWADFQCPYCARFTEQIESLLVPLYVKDGQARLTFHDLAFIGTESQDAAVAARVAGAQTDQFWAYHDLLFANQHGENKGAFARSRLADMAVTLGLDRAAFLTAMDDPTFLAAVKAETAEGNGLGVRSTPTIFINGQVFDDLLDWAKLAAHLDGLIAAASAVPAPGSVAP